MNSRAFSYLNFIHFSQLNKWYVSCYINPHIIKSKYKLVSLEKLMKPYKKLIKKNDYKGDVPIIEKISFKDGKIHYRKEFKTGMNLYELKPKQLLVSKINFHQGALSIADGIITNCSTHYQPYEVDYSSVLSDYLVFVIRSNKFQQYLSYLRADGIKNEATYDFIKTLKIPLPTLEKQKEIVDRYNEKIKLAEEQEKEAQNLEQEIDQYICEILGIKIQNQLEQNKISYLNFTSLKKLSRWDVYNNKNQVLSTKYNFGKLKDIIIGKPLYGAGEKGINRKTDVRYIRITDINEDGSLNNDVISAENVDEKYLLKANDFLIARSGNTVGKTFLYKEKFGKCIYAGYLIKFTLNLQKIIPEYLLYYTKSTAYKSWINSNQRANAQPNINSNEYLNSPIIIPEIQIQQKLVETISLKKERIHNLKEISEQNRQLAQEEFEKELFE